MIITSFTTSHVTNSSSLHHNHTYHPEDKCQLHLHITWRMDENRYFIILISNWDKVLEVHVTFMQLQFCYSTVHDPNCPCHFIPSKSISEFTSLSDAPHNYSSPLGDPGTEQVRLLTYPSHPSQAREEWAPSWLSAIVSPLPLSCSLQLEIVYVDIMRIELLIKKKLRSKITFYPLIWAG